jgi:endonuclease VIII
MPEGDIIFRAARALHHDLAGRTVTRFDSVYLALTYPALTYPALTRRAQNHPIAGRTIDSISSRGKHLLIAFSGDLVLHTHMRMNGS